MQFTEEDLKGIEELLKASFDEALQTSNQKSKKPKPQSTNQSNQPTLDEALDTYITSNPILDQLYNHKECPRCGAKLVPTIAITGAPSTDWLECSNPVCNTYVDMYHPMPHQTSVHEDAHRIIGNFGSYGTGKTKTSEKEMEKHIFLTPNANILLGANITSQYEQTLLRDFEKSFPLAFLKSRSVQKGYLDFVNDARLMLRPFDDPDKLRSNNYSMVIMLEASEINADAFHQLKTRLRNTAATNKTNNSDWRKLICESNPDSGKHIKPCPSINIPLIHLKTWCQVQSERSPIPCVHWMNML